MKRLKKIFILFIFKLLPSTKLYKFKNILLNFIDKFEISETARIVSSVKFIGVENITIGSDTFIGHETIIIGSNYTSVNIGSNCDISSKVTFVTGSHEIDVKGDHIAGKGLGKNILVNNGSWIGINSTIMPGITIGEKSIIAAGSIVTKNVQEYVVVGGNPAKIIRKLK